MSKLKEKKQVRTNKITATTDDSQTNEVQIIVEKHEKQPNGEVINATKKISGKRYTIIGIIMFVFAVIGFIGTVIFSFQFIQNVVNNNSLKLELESEVYPLVIVDIPAFEDVNDLDSKVVVTAGVWNFIMNATDIDKYTVTDEFGTMAVPAVDIEVYIKDIFGDNIEIQHQAILDTQFYIPYDETESMYYISSSSTQNMSYAPDVTEIQKMEDGTITATIGYIAPGPFWNLQENAQQNEITKIMIYTLEQNEDKNYIITSVSINQASFPLSEDDTTSSEENTSSEDDTTSDEENTSSEE